MSKEEATKKLRNDVLIGLGGLLAALITLALTGGKGILGILLPFAEAMVVIFSLTQGIYHWRVKSGLVPEESVQGPHKDTLSPLPPTTKEAPGLTTDDTSHFEKKDNCSSSSLSECEDIPKQAVFCPFCGQKLLKSGDFCPRCGKKRKR